MPTIIHFTESGEPDCNHDGPVDHAKCPKPEPLFQTDTWTTKDGRTVKLEDMTNGHRVNLVGLLRRKADLLAMGYFFRLWSSPLAPQGDMATLGVEQWEQESIRDPESWIDSTPLVRRLLELIADESVCPDCGGHGWEQASIPKEACAGCLGTGRQEVPA